VFVLPGLQTSQRYYVTTAGQPTFNTMTYHEHTQMYAAVSMATLKLCPAALMESEESVNNKHTIST